MCTMVHHRQNRELLDMTFVIDQYWKVLFVFSPVTATMKAKDKGLLLLKRM